MEKAECKILAVQNVWHVRLYTNNPFRRRYR